MAALLTLKLQTGGQTGGQTSNEGGRLAPVVFGTPLAALLRPDALHSLRFHSGLELRVWGSALYLTQKS